MAKGGNDTTGNGQSYLPYATLTKAISVIPTTTTTDTYTIIVYPGRYTESTITIADKNINIVGFQSQTDTFNTQLYTNFIITSSNASRYMRQVSFRNVQILGGASADAITLTTTGSGAGQLVLDNCYCGFQTATTGKSWLKCSALSNYFIKISLCLFPITTTMTAPVFSLGSSSYTQFNLSAIDYQPAVASGANPTSLVAIGGQSTFFAGRSSFVSSGTNSQALTNGLIYITTNATVSGVPYPVQMQSCIFSAFTEGTVIATPPYFNPLGANGSAAINVAKSSTNLWVINNQFGVRTTGANAIIGSGASGSNMTVYYSADNTAYPNYANKYDTTNLTATAMSALSV